MVPEGPRVGFLDGIRGMAALWVMTGHILLAYDMHLPFATWVSLPVDAFIIVSGFLMVHQTRARESREPFERFGSWLLFWLRRCFRIAPLYYAILVIVLAFSQYQRGFDLAFEYPTWGGIRTEHEAFAVNVLNHVTFAFGLFPKFQRAVPIPDWSISLEMQFYALFPLMMMIGSRLGWLKFVSIVAAACITIGFVFSSFLQQFTLPSILILKINVFLAGMLIALASHDLTNRISYLLAALALVALPIWGSENFEMDIYRAMICLGISGLAFSYSIKNTPILSPLLATTAETLGKQPMVLLADLSYGVYLIHFPILALWILVAAPGRLLSGANSVLVALLSVTVTTYLLAWLAHHLLEQPAINFGRRIIERVRKAL
jgi:peptidoglycan/LPS O-acetylase OafA/YrhL